MGENVDWYDRRSELRGGMVFRSCWGIVRLDRRVPGDGTDWYCESWSGDSDGLEGGWYDDDARIHPADLEERLPDDFGKAAQPRPGF